MDLEAYPDIKKKSQTLLRDFRAGRINLEAYTKRCSELTDEYEALERVKKEKELNELMKSPIQNYESILEYLLKEKSIHLNIVRDRLEGPNRIIIADYIAFSVFSKS